MTSESDARTLADAVRVLVEDEAFERCPCCGGGVDGCKDGCAWAAVEVALSYWAEPNDGGPEAAPSESDAETSDEYDRGWDDAMEYQGDENGVLRHRVMVLEKAIAAPSESDAPYEQCPGCGDDLPETTPGNDGAWFVMDGESLGCGCDGSWAADGEQTYPMHDDDCQQCQEGEAPPSESDAQARSRRHHAALMWDEAKHGGAWTLSEAFEVGAMFEAESQAADRVLAPSKSDEARADDGRNCKRWWARSEREIGGRREQESFCDECGDCTGRAGGWCGRADRRAEAAELAKKLGWDTDEPEQCPGCGECLPESLGMLSDGQLLSCTCDGGWNVDGEPDPWPSHADDCQRCTDLLRAETLSNPGESESDEARAREANDGSLPNDFDYRAGFVDGLAVGRADVRAIADENYGLLMVLQDYTDVSADAMRATARSRITSLHPKAYTPRTLTNADLDARGELLGGNPDGAAEA